MAPRAEIEPKEELSLQPAPSLSGADGTGVTGAMML